MANATIQFTQAANVGADGQSVLGFVKNQPVTMTDAGGAGATSYQWSIVSWPSPLSSPPAITNATAQVATIATPVGGFSDGVYIVKLLRTEGSTVTADVRFFGVGDEDGLILPSPGQSANMHNTGTTPLLAIKAGWAGRADATSNDQLDAYLRFLKSRVGRWIGSPQAINFTSSSASTVPYTDGTDKPFRIVTLTGSGVYTEELDAALTAGKVVRYLATISAGAGGLTLKSGIGGATILALTAPSTGTAAYEVEAAYTGSAWVISQLTPLRGPANQVVKTDGSKVAFGLLDNSSIAANAAIDGSKINPDFGSQTVIAANVTVSGLTTNAFVKTNGSSQLTTQTGINLSDLTTGSQAQGDLAYFNGTSWVRLPAGTSGHVLHTQGGGANPQWAAVTPDFGSQDVLTTGVFYGSKFAFGGGGPTITNGTGAPSGSEPNGSVYLRTNGTNAETGVYTRQAGAWYALGGGSTGPAGGDLADTYPNPTVAKINGASVPVAGSLTTGHLLQVAGAAALTYALLANANVASNAAIDGTKINPNFGSQAIVTTGNVTGAVTTLHRILYANGYTPQWASVTQVSVAVSDQTLNAAQYGTPIIEVTGALSVDRIVTFPLSNGQSATTNGSVWFVRNATTGGYNVTVKGPTGFGVQVPYGGSAVVYTDGTNFYSVGASGSGGGSSGAASGDLVGSYPGPQVAFLSGTGGIVTAVAPYFAIDSTITTAYTFVPGVTTSAGGAGFKYTFTGQHGKVAAASGHGGGVEVVGGNAGSATAIGGGLTVLLGDNTYDATRGGYVRVVQASGVSGVMQAWIDGSGNVAAHALDSGFNIGSGKKLYFGGTSVPITLTSVPTMTAGPGDPTANEPTGSVYLKTGATATTEVFWVRQGSTWASLGQPTGAAGGDLSGTYPNPTVAKVNGTTVPAGGSLTTGHLLRVTGAAALTYGFIANANVDASAAIAGTKISPDFGSQNIQTLGNIQTAKITLGSSGPTISRGTGNPAASEANGSVYFRTDGTDGSDGVWTRQGGAWYQVGAGSGGPPTGPAGGDLSGTYPNPTVAKVNGTSVPATPSANTVLVATNGTTASWALLANANVASNAAIAGTKISPDFGSQTVTAAKVTIGASGPTITKGTGVPSTSSEPAGSLFMRTDGTDGATALYSYQASAWVAIGTGGGAAPTGPAGGDLSGSYPNPDVAKIKGITLPVSAPAASGYFLKSISTSATTYALLTSSDIPSATGAATGAVQLTNDLAGSATVPTVVALTGASSIVMMRANSFQWLASATPNLTQATPTTDVAAKDLTITSQAPWAAASSNVSPGNIILAVPAGVGGSPPYGKVSFTISGSEQAHVTNGEFTLGTSTRLYLGGNTLPAVFSGVGAPSASAPDGSFYLVRGATGASTTAYVRASGAWSALGAGGGGSASGTSYTDTNTPTFGSSNVQGALDAIKALLAPGGTRLSGSTYAAAYGVSGVQSTGSTVFTGVGMIRFNPSHFWPAIDGSSSRRIKFRAYLESTGGLTAEVRLYNITSSAVVASSTLTTASATPVLLTSVDITGNLTAGVEHDYEVQIRLTGSPSDSDRAICKMAQLEVTYV